MPGTRVHLRRNKDLTSSATHDRKIRVSAARVPETLWHAQDLAESVRTRPVLP